MIFSERRRETFGGPRPMGINNNEANRPDHCPCCWGGADAYLLDGSGVVVARRRRRMD